MAPNVPIAFAQERKSTLRETTRTFLLKAQQTLSEQCGFADRYYRLRINSILDPDQDDLEAISRFACQSLLCPRCGTRLDPRYRSRKKKNRAKDRKTCRHLRADLVELCATCGYRSKKITFTSTNRKKEPLPHSSTVPSRPETKTSLKSAKTSLKSAKPEAQQEVKRFIRKGPKRFEASNQPKNTPQFSNRLRAFTCLLEPK